MVAILVIELTSVGRTPPPPPPEPMDAELIPPPQELQAAVAPAAQPAVQPVQPVQPVVEPPPPEPAPPPPPPPPPDVAAAEPILEPPPPPAGEAPKPPPVPHKPPPRVVAAAKPAKPAEARADTAHVIQATAPATATPGPADSGVGRIGNGKPVYPQSMVDQEREGSADAVCDVLPDGAVGDCRLLGVQGGAAFGPAVLAFLKTQHFRPAIRGGQSVEAEYRYHFDFKLVD